MGKATAINLPTPSRVSQNLLNKNKRTSTRHKKFSSWCGDFEERGGLFVTFTQTFMPRWLRQDTTSVLRARSANWESLKIQESQWFPQMLPAHCVIFQFHSATEMITWWKSQTFPGVLSCCDRDSEDWNTSSGPMLPKDHLIHFLKIGIPLQTMRAFLPFYTSLIVRFSIFQRKCHASRLKNYWIKVCNLRSWMQILKHNELSPWW